MVRLTDRPDMTLDVYRGRKTTIQHTTTSSAEHFRYTIVTRFNKVSYDGWILKEEEYEETNLVKILQLT